MGQGKQAASCCPSLWYNVLSFILLLLEFVHFLPSVLHKVFNCINMAARKSVSDSMISMLSKHNKFVFFSIAYCEEMQPSRYRKTITVAVQVRCGHSVEAP